MDWLETRGLWLRKKVGERRGLDRQILANGNGPLSKIEAMCFEKGQGQPVQAKGYATRVSLVAIFSQQVPNRTEVVTVTIEAHASGRLSFGTQWNKQLKL